MSELMFSLLRFFIQHIVHEKRVAAFICMSLLIFMGGGANAFGEVGDINAIVPQRQFIMSDGAAIPVRIWPSHGTSRFIILAYHGFNDSRDNWEDVAPLFNEAGVTIMAPDQRGFGQAPMRGGWAGYQRMARDVKEEAEMIRRDYPDQPLYLMGESMGGAVIYTALTDMGPLPIKGAILLAPAIWDIGLAPRAFLDMLAFFAPRYEVTAKDIPVHPVASNNQAALRRLYYDPLSLHSTQLKSAKGLVKLMHHAYRRVGAAHQPVLCIYGDSDQFVPPAAMRKFWKKLQPPRKFDYVPQAYHLLSRDDHRKQITNDILSWMNHPGDTLPSGGEERAQIWLERHH